MTANEQSVETLTRLLEAASKHIKQNREPLRESFEYLDSEGGIHLIEESLDELIDALTEYMIDNYPERAWDNMP